MNKATYSLTFNRKGRLNKRGKGSVEIYCYIEGRSKYIRTGVEILPAEWDKRKRRVKDNSNEVKLNILLARMLSKIEKYELDVHNSKGDFTFADLERFSLNGEPQKDNFIAWLKKEIEGDHTVKPGTMGYRLNMLNKLIQVTGDQVQGANVNYEMIKNFNNHLAKQKLNQSTQSKLHSQLKKFITIAVHQGLIEKNPYNAFRVKRPNYDMKKCLWFGDLDRIWDLRYPKDSPVELARLKFLFSCYTGLRISDNTALTWDQVREGKLFVRMIKTVRPVVVPLGTLGDRAQIILDKAKKVYKGDNIFPYMPDQRVNKYLKRIGIDAEIPFPLTFHVARHTFCTILAHQSGSVFKVMQHAGIYKVETAMTYISLAKIYD